MDNFGSFTVPPGRIMKMPETIEIAPAQGYRCVACGHVFENMPDGTMLHREFGCAHDGVRAKRPVLLAEVVDSAVGLPEERSKEVDWAKVGESWFGSDMELASDGFYKLTDKAKSSWTYRRED